MTPSRVVLFPAVLVLAVACGRAAATADVAPHRGAAATTASALPVIDSARLVGDLFRLAHDSMGGRGVGTPENAKARAWLAAEFRRLGLAPVGGAYTHDFVRPPRRGATDSLRGVNVLGVVRGRTSPERVLVVSAHYDHVGTRNGVVFNGADDNASGTAAVLAMAAWFQAHPPAHSILFALWDAEEVGLQGARAFVAAPPVPLVAGVPRATIAANVNLDMVSRNDRGELYAAGATPYPQMRPVLEGLVPDAPVTLKLGHDSGGGQDDWTNQSDQGAFHAVGIPFVYFGVEDHPDYHRATDDPERIQPGFYVRAVRTIAAFVARLDVAVGAWPAR